MITGFASVRAAATRVDESPSPLFGIRGAQPAPWMRPKQSLGRRKVSRVYCLDNRRRHDRLFHAGIVESEVEAPECLDSLIQRYLHISGSRHVAPNCDRAAASLFNHACRGPAFRAAIVGRFQASVIFRAASPA